MAHMYARGSLNLITQTAALLDVLMHKATNAVHFLIFFLM